MDCKIGVRTYLEEELAKAKEKPKLRKVGIITFIFSINVDTPNNYNKCGHIAALLYRTCTRKWFRSIRTLRRKKNTGWRAWRNRGKIDGRIFFYTPILPSCDIIILEYDWYAMRFPSVCYLFFLSCLARKTENTWDLSSSTAYAFNLSSKSST